MSETYTIGGSDYQPLTGFDIFGQTFTPLESHFIDFIDLDLWLWSYTPPSIYLTQCDAAHEPIGPILANGFMSDPFTYLAPSKRRVRFQLDNPVALIMGQTYAIHMRKNIGHVGEDDQVFYDKDDATYPRGHIIFSDNGGVSWTHFHNSDFIFCEFGNPPLPKPKPPPPVENFAALSAIYYLRINGYHIRIATSVPCHLTCYWTDVKPLRHHTSRTIRGAKVPWGQYFCFVAWNAIEQMEAGDTLYHTFNHTPWPQCQTRWFTFRGEVDNILSPSVGPIFEKHYAGAYDLFKNPSFETWPHPDQPPTWWTWTAPDPGNTWVKRDATDKTHGNYAAYLYTDGYVPWRRLYQEIDATPHRGHWIQIRPDMKGNPINQTGVNISWNGTPPYGDLKGPASPDYWSHVDFVRKVPMDATIIRCELRCDSFWHVPNWCLFDNIRSVVYPIT